MFAPVFVRTALVAALVGIAGACEPPARTAPQNETLDQVVHSVVAAIEARDPGAVLDYVAYEFSSGDDLDYSSVLAIIDSLLLGNEHVSAELESLEVTEPEPRRGKVVARLAFAPEARAVSGEMPFDAVHYAFDLEFAKRGQRWQAISGTYQRE